jgi:hypothetical protein
VISNAADHKSAASLLLRRAQSGCEGPCQVRFLTGFGASGGGGNVIIIGAHDTFESLRTAEPAIVEWSGAGEAAGLAMPSRKHRNLPECGLVDTRLPDSIEREAMQPESRCEKPYEH